MPLVLTGTKARWALRKVLRERAVDLERRGSHVAALPPSRPADTRSLSTYGVHMRHDPASESDTWATLVKANRKRLQLTLKETADLIGVSRETVIRWESRGAQPGTIETTDKAAQVLGLDRALARRLTGYARDEGIDAEPDMWTYARSLRLDPHDQVVREILDGPWSDETMRHMLREERRLQDEDRRRRLDRVRLAKDMFEGGASDGLDQAAG